jgi:hypothetical protein
MTTDSPLLRQFGDLTARDFQAHPVWVGCHTADYDQPWYDQTDEETFRPFMGKLPASPEEGMLLVRARAVLSDGTTFPAMVTPAFPDEAEDGGRILGTQQPSVFAPTARVMFWYGGFEPTPEAIDSAYRALGAKSAAAVFPLRFEVESGLTSGQANAVVKGFYWLRDFKDVTVRT